MIRYPSPTPARSALIICASSDLSGPPDASRATSAPARRRAASLPRRGVPPLSGSFGAAISRRLSAPRSTPFRARYCGGPPVLSQRDEVVLACAGRLGQHDLEAAL